MDEDIVAALEELNCLSVAALKAKYKEEFGREATLTNRTWLLRNIAWQMQAKMAGGLSERALRRAAEIVDDADLRTRAPRRLVPANQRTSKRALKSYFPSVKDWRLPATGTLITRRYRERTIIVKVLESGFEYESARYVSLSAIARKITGTRWNGFKFFGLGTAGE